MDGKTLMENNNTLCQTGANMLGAMKCYGHAIMNVALACGKPRNDVLRDEEFCWQRFEAAAEAHQAEITRFLAALRASRQIREQARGGK
jgi:hypothetical protein